MQIGNRLIILLTTVMRTIENCKMFELSEKLLLLSSRLSFVNFADIIN